MGDVLNFKCPYCGNQAIIPESFSGLYKPDYVVPFSVDKESAKGKLKDFVKGKKLLPKSFTSGNRIENITGLYVPFWLYSCKADGTVTFEGVKKSTREDVRYTYVIRGMRYSAGRLEWEIPAGGVEKGEAIEDAARREVIEETGCTVKDLKFLYSQTPSNGMTDQVMHVFGARSLCCYI